MRAKHWKIRDDVDYARLVELLRGQSAGGQAIGYYLAIRKKEGIGPATLAELEKKLEVSRRTIERAMPALRRANLIVEELQRPLIS